MNKSDILYSWDFSAEKNRWKLWYMITISVVIWLVIWWFLTGQYGMSFILLLLSGLVYFVENNSPDSVNVAITKLWIKVWDSFYDFSIIDSFAMIYEWENAVFMKLNLKKKGLRVIDLNIDNTIALNIKEILPEYIKENSKWELWFVDKMIRLLKL